MEIKFVKESEDGAVEFTSTLQEDEVRYLLEFAINHLLALGSLPFINGEKVLAETITPGSLSIN